MEDVDIQLTSKEVDFKYAQQRIRLSAIGSRKDLLDSIDSNQKIWSSKLSRPLRR